MMSSQLRQTDAQILMQIVQQANQRYLRQSRVNRKSTFNILRVLSAYKQNSENFTGRKQQIYNWIIYLTKHYNPQTYPAWINAIRDISNLSKTTSRNIANQANNHNASCYSNANANYLTAYPNSLMNKTVNQFYHEMHDTSDQYTHYQNKSVMIPTPYERQCALRNKARHVISRQNSQSIMPPICTKQKHYISFQPNQQNKQNINSGNTSQHQQCDNTKLDHPSKTPGEQSFIHHLPLSYYGSPFVFSKVTNNTKEVTEVYESEKLTEEDVIMRTRADGFRNINLQFKVFSALMANFQAFEVFQQLIHKTKVFQTKLYFNRFLNSTQLFSSQNRQYLQVINKAEKHYKTKQLKKSFKILQVFYKLKISRVRRVIKKQEINHRGFQFLMTIIFSSSADQNDPQYNDTPKSIRNKCKYFQNIQDCEKMQIISEFFINNLKLNKEQINNLFIMYNNAKKRRIFQILKNNIRDFKKQIQLISQFKKQKGVKTFISCSRQIFANNGRVSLMKLKKNRELKEKCFKAIYQFQISKKVYTKRQQFLTNKHNYLMQQSIMRIWQQRLSQVKTKKLSYCMKIQKSISMISSLIKSKHFQTIKNVCEQKKNKLIKQQMQNNARICKQIFQFLKTRVFQRKNYNKIKLKSSQKALKSIFKLWLKKQSIITLIKKISRLFMKAPLRKIVQEVKFTNQQEKLEKYIKKQIYIQGMKRFRINFNLENTQREGKIKKLENSIKQFQISIFMAICKNNICTDRKQNQRKVIDQKTQQVRAILSLSRKKQFIQIFSEDYKTNRNLTNKQNIIKSVIGDRQINRLFLNQDKIQNELNYSKLTQTFTRSHKIMKKQVFEWLQHQKLFRLNKQKLTVFLKSQMNTNLLNKIQIWRQQAIQYGKYKRVVNNRQSHMKKWIISIFNLRITHNKRLNIIADAKFQKNLKFKTLLSFANNIIHQESQINSFKNKLNQNKKIESIRKFAFEIKSDMKVKRKLANLRRKLFIKQLVNCSKRTNSNWDKVQKVVNLRKILYFKRIPQYKMEMIKVRRQKQLQQKVQKKISIVKVNFAVFRNILRKKQHYMALKFRALRLCEKAFKILLISSHKNEGQTFRQSKKFRLHDHISTSYSSL